jgi:hypothetical protein
VNCDYRTSYDEALPRETAQHIKFDKIWVDIFPGMDYT